MAIDRYRSSCFLNTTQLLPSQSVTLPPPPSRARVRLAVFDPVHPKLEELLGEITNCLHAHHHMYTKTRVKGEQWEEVLHIALFNLRVPHEWNAGSHAVGTDIVLPGGLTVSVKSAIYDQGKGTLKFSGSRNGKNSHSIQGILDNLNRTKSDLYLVLARSETLAEGVYEYFVFIFHAADLDYGKAEDWSEAIIRKDSGEEVKGWSYDTPSLSANIAPGLSYQVWHTLNLAEAGLTPLHQVSIPVEDKTPRSLDNIPNYRLNESDTHIFNTLDKNPEGMCLSDLILATGLSEEALRRRLPQLSSSGYLVKQGNTKSTVDTAMWQSSSVWEDHPAAQRNIPRVPLSRAKNTKEVKLSSNDIALLRQIDILRAPTTKEIAAVVERSHPIVTDRLRELKLAGLAKRKRSPRKIYWALTEAGKDATEGNTYTIRLAKQNTPASRVGPLTEQEASLYNHLVATPGLTDERLSYELQKPLQTISALLNNLSLAGLAERNESFTGKTRWFPKQNETRVKANRGSRSRAKTSL